MTNDEDLRWAAQRCIGIDGMPVMATSQRYTTYLAAANPARVLALLDERDRAVASVAALLHAYIGITPGATVDGLAPEVQTEAERLLEERLALKSERDKLRDERNTLCVALEAIAVADDAEGEVYGRLYDAAAVARAALASVGVRDA